MAEVILPAALGRLFPGLGRREPAEGGHVAALLTDLDARFPGLRDRIADSSPAIRRHIAVFVDGERGGLDTEVGPRSRVEFLAAISGG